MSDPFVALRSGDILVLALSCCLLLALFSASCFYMAYRLKQRSRRPRR